MKVDPLSGADLARLDRLRAALDPADAEWLASRLEPRWLQRERRLVHRDGIVRMASFVLCAGMPPKTAARHLGTLLTRYLATPWRDQQHVAVLPFETPIVQVFMHGIARQNDGRPIAERQLMNILSGSRTPPAVK